ncbi:MAG: hypothetical protein RLZZ175_1212 [Bacteroidota bacterium]|jgi:small conductance mechanosensitive channel
MPTSLTQLEIYTQHIIKLALEYLPKFGLALLVLLGGLWVIEKMSNSINKSFQKKDIDVSLRSFLISLITILFKVLLLVSVAGMIGIQTTSFVAILGAAGLAVGLALQGSLSNFAGGVLILVFKPYKVGDSIEGMGKSGKVKEIQIFNTILLTSDNKTVILPNGALANGTVVNSSKEGTLVVTSTIPLELDTDIEKLKIIGLEVLKSEAKVIQEPSPAVKIAKINPNHIEVNFTAHTNAGDASALLPILNEKLLIALRNNQIQIAKA